MSLILDALRKSEAERRRGQAPNLFASLPAATAPGPGNLRRYWPVFAFALLLLAAGFVFWNGGTATTAVVAADVEADDAATDEAEMPAHASAAPAPALAASTAPAPVPAPVPASPPPATAPTPPVAAAALAANTPAPIPVARAVSNTPASVTTRDAKLAGAPLSPPPADEPVAEEALPPIAVLAASERAALPPLKLSMHVWASEPAKRFAIIDGQRVAEGASVGSSVIEEIRHDGVVLNIDGRRILLPRP